MKIKNVLPIIAFIFLITTSVSAEIRNCISKQVNIVAGNLQTDSAHLLDIIGCEQICGSLTGRNRTYIEFTDRDIIAVAITADTKDRPVSVIYESQAPPKGIVEHGAGGVVTCKILNIWGL